MTWIIDGVNLSEMAWNVEKRSTGWRIPPKRGENGVVQGRHGQVYVPNKVFDQNTLSMKMWAVGCLPDGTFPTEQTRRAQTRENLDRLSQLFGKTTGMLECIQVESAGYGQVNEVLNPAFEAATGTAVEQYRNLLTNPGARDMDPEYEQYRNLFENPDNVGEDWTLFGENAFTDPLHKKYRSSTYTAVGQQNLFTAPSFDSNHTFSSGAKLHTTSWFTGAPSSVECTVEPTATAWGNQSIRVRAAANTAAGTVLGRLRAMDVPAGSQPSFRMSIRASAGLPASKTIGWRLVFIGTTGDLRTTTWQVVSNAGQPSQPWIVGLSWDEIVAGLPDAMEGASSIAVEFQNVDAWVTGDAFVMDEFTLSPGVVFDRDGLVLREQPRQDLLPPRFWGDDSWTSWTGFIGQSVSQMRTVEDPRWEVMPYTLDGTRSMATAAGLNLLTSDAGGTSCGFYAQGPVTTSMAQAFRRQCGQVVPGRKYWTRIEARVANTRQVRFSLCSSTDGGQTLVERRSEVVTGTNPASGQGLTGSTVTVALPSYTPEAGEDLYVVVTMGVISAATMGAQITTIGVQSWTLTVRNAEIVDTDNTRYVWAGDQFDSNTEIWKRQIPQVASLHSITEDGGRWVESAAGSESDAEVAGVVLRDIAVNQRMRDNGVRVSALAYAKQLVGSVRIRKWVAAEVHEVDGDGGVTSVHVGPRTELQTVEGAWLVEVNVPDIAPDTVAVRVRFHLQDPKTGEGLFLRQILVADVGQTVPFVSGTTDGVWAGEPNASQTIHQIPYPTDWHAAHGLAQTEEMATDGCARATAVDVDDVAIGHRKQIPAGSYQVGASLAAFTTADVRVRAMDGETVLSEERLGSLGRVTALSQTSQVQTTLDFPSEGTEVRFVALPIGKTQEVLDMTTALEGRQNLAENASFIVVPEYISYGGGASVELSDEWVFDGDTSFKIVPQPGNNNSAVYPHGALGFDHAGFAPGETYTVSAYLRLAETQTGTLADSARKITIGVDHLDATPRDYYFAQSEAAPNTPGVHRVSCTFTLPLDNIAGAFVRLMNGSPNTPVWWDALLVERGTEVREWIDGATPGVVPYAHRSGQTAYGLTTLTENAGRLTVEWAEALTSAGFQWTLSEAIPQGAWYSVTATVESEDQTVPGQIRVWPTRFPLVGVGSAVEAGVPVVGESKYRLRQQAATAPVEQINFYLTQIVNPQQIQPGSLTISDLRVEWSMEDRVDVCVDEAYLYDTVDSSLPRLEANRLINPDFRGTAGWGDARPPKVVKTNALTSLAGLIRGGAAGLTLAPPYGVRVRATGAWTSGVYPWGQQEDAEKGVMTPGKTYTVSATIRIVTPQTGPEHYAARGIAIGWGETFEVMAKNLGHVVSESAPNEPGTYRVSVTATIPEGMPFNRIRLMNGAQTGDVWWSDVVLAEHFPIELVSTGFGTAMHGELMVNNAVLPAEPLHVRGMVRSVEAGSTIQVRWFDADGEDLGVTVAGTAEGGSRMEAVGGTVTPPPGAVSGRFEAKDSGAGFWLHDGYAAPVLPGRDYDEGTDVFQWRYFDGSSEADPYGFPTEWVGEPDRSESAALASFARGWRLPSPWVLLADPPYRPPGSVGTVGAIASVAPGEQVVAVSTPVEATGPMTSGQIALRRSRESVEVAVQVMGYTDAEGSGGTVLWSHVLEEIAERVVWRDLPSQWSHLGVVVTYTETAAERRTGWAVWADNLMVLFHDEALLTEYPGYFDGSTSSGGWNGEPNNSTSTQYAGARRFYAEVLDGIPMESQAGGTRAEFEVPLVVPGAFFEDMAQSRTIQSVTGVAEEVPLVDFRGATAPLVDLVVTITQEAAAGPEWIRLRDKASGAWVQYDGSLAEGESVTIDCGEFEAVKDGVSVSRSLTRGGSSGLLVMNAVAHGQPPVLVVECGPHDGQFQVAVVGRRRYLIA